MKLIFRYMKPYAIMIFSAVALKFLSMVFELTIPYILEYMIDFIVPLGEMSLVVWWGLLLFLAALLNWLTGVLANTIAIRNARNVGYDVRRDLFSRTANLSGRQFDTFTLPSLISRMTSDSYNVQTGVQQLQSLCVRAPMLLAGGLIMMLLMDWRLALVLVCLLPLLFAIILIVSSRGIPLYVSVQQRLDDIVRIMRENITGIRVVKALSKTEYEKKRFERANTSMTAADIKAGTVMAIPGPFLQLLMNVGLTVVVYLGSQRVNNGEIQPGVILAFLTYFNMITMGIMGVNRIFTTLSKATASAERIRAVIDCEPDQKVLPVSDAATPHGNEFIRFEHVTFSYVTETKEMDAQFTGGTRQNALEDISFALEKGGSLGIIGPTGCGKSTILSLLMRFYDAASGAVFVDGKDVRTYEKDTLRRKFGTVFQNDVIFRDTLRENIAFSRPMLDEAIGEAAADAQAEEFIRNLPDGLNHEAAIKGANLSGGQKQRILVARALAGRPEILVLDDSSSALDYKTDAAMRRAITEHHRDSTLILIAQRISSVMNMDHILVMDNGRSIGYGTHAELLETCAPYREIYESQMGAMR